MPRSYGMLPRDSELSDLDVEAVDKDATASELERSVPSRHALMRECVTMVRECESDFE